MDEAALAHLAPLEDGIRGPRHRCGGQHEACPARHQEWLMPPRKTLQEREKEMQALLATPTGREQLRQLESRCQSRSGRLRPANTSVITYILVHEREQDLLRS